MLLYLNPSLIGEGWEKMKTIIPHSILCYTVVTKQELSCKNLTFETLVLCFSWEFHWGENRHTRVWVVSSSLICFSILGMTTWWRRDSLLVILFLYFMILPLLRSTTTHPAAPVRPTLFRRPFSHLKFLRRGGSPLFITVMTQGEVKYGGSLGEYAGRLIRTLNNKSNLIATAIECVYAEQRQHQQQFGWIVAFANKKRAVMSARTKNNNVNSA